MSNRSFIPTILALAILTFSSYGLLACTPMPAPEPLRSDTPDEDAFANGLSAISVGTEDRLVEVPVDDEVTTWLNTIDSSDAAMPPTPEVDDWHSFTMPSAGTSVIFDVDIQTSFDVLEILAYPDGLDDEGVPVNIDIHPLCGPQAERSCADVAWGTNGVQIPYEIVDAAIADTEYFAIGGILRPAANSHPDSFMALLRNPREGETEN